MMTAEQLAIRDALISARERFRKIYEEEASPSYAAWARRQAMEGIEEADKALSKPEADR